MKKEQIILEYLELKYGNRETYENINAIGINAVCIYYKNIKQVGVSGRINLDLVKWFGDKYNLELVT